MTIIEFLEARITEDEISATLRDCHREDCGWIPDEAGYSYPCNCGVPERMAAECAAKRAIIAQVSDVAWGGYAVRDVILGHLAAIYADHQDYQKEWSK